jgi:O-antigen/teichoic acid export membrane protein
MNIFKATTINFCSNGLKLLCGLAVTKIIALQTGPAGLALVGQMGNLISLLLQYTNGGVGNGVIKYVAEYNSANKSNESIKVVDTALSLTLVASVGIALFLGLFKDFVATFIFGTHQHAWVIKWLAWFLPVMALGYLLLFVLNGYKRIKDYAIIGSLNGVAGVLLAWIFTASLGISGALISNIASQVFLFFIALSFFIYKKNGFTIPRFLLDQKVLRNLLNFVMMGLVSGSLAPLSQMFLRSYIASNASFETAGQWQAVWRLSEAYLSLILTPLSIYYLPRLSEIHNYRELKTELKTTLCFSLPLTIAFSFTVYALRTRVIETLFSAEFIPIIPLLPFQLAGDVIKVASWIIGMIMWAKSMTRLLIITELLFTASFVALTTLAFNYYGLIGTAYGYLVNYALYLAFLVVYFYRNLKSILEPKLD